MFYTECTDLGFFSNRVSVRTSVRAIIQFVYSVYLIELPSLLVRLPSSKILARVEEANLLALVVLSSFLSRRLRRPFVLLSDRKRCSWP